MVDKAIILFKIIALNIFDLNTKAYDCNECIKRKYYLDRNCSGEEKEIIIRDKNVRFTIDKDTYINYCPKLLYEDVEIVNLINGFMFYQKGIPYSSNTFLDEYFYIIDAFNAMTEVLSQRPTPKGEGL